MSDIEEAASEYIPDHELAYYSPTPGAAMTFREGDEVRVVAGVAVFGGQLGEVRGWDGSTYRVLVRNKAGFPWLVQLPPTQVEAGSQLQEDM